MSHYVDGFVVPVPRANLEAYRRRSDRCAEVWLEYGALQSRECRGDDVKPGTLTSFPQSVQLKDDEVVVFSWIVYRNREERDRINEKVMADPRLKDMMDPAHLPFDGKRMVWGGFETIVEVDAKT